MQSNDLVLAIVTELRSNNPLLLGSTEVPLLLGDVPLSSSVSVGSALGGLCNEPKGQVSPTRASRIYAPTQLGPGIQINDIVLVTKTELYSDNCHDHTVVDAPFLTRHET